MRTRNISVPFRVTEKELEAIDKKATALEKKESKLSLKEAELDKLKEEMEEFHQKQLHELEKISGMSIIQTHILVFTYSSKYYEIKGNQGISLRKYLAWYQNFTTVIKNSEMKEV